MKLSFTLKQLIFTLLVVTTIGAFAISDWKPYLPSATFDEAQSGAFNAILNLFVQKSGDTMSGNLILGTAGNGLQIKEGTDARMGQAALAGTSKAVTNASITAATRIFLTRVGTGVTMGNLSYTNTNYGFLIASTSSETNTINWMAVEAP